MLEYLVIRSTSLWVIDGKQSQEILLWSDSLDECLALVKSLGDGDQMTRIVKTVGIAMPDGLYVLNEDGTGNNVGFD